MSSPRFSPLSSDHFRVGFGPRGTAQRLILTQIHVDRIAGCDGRVVTGYDPLIDQISVVRNPAGSRFKKHFITPWELRSEEDVQRATRSVLLRAPENIANRVAFTPLGIPPDGILSPNQSARAMLGAIFALWSDSASNVPNQVLISIHSNPEAYQAFENALKEHFFPYRRADNANVKLGWRKAIRRLSARSFGREGQALIEYLEALETAAGREAILEVVDEIHRFVKQRPDLFTPGDVNRMLRFDSYAGIPETLLILRNVGGPTGEAARLALMDHERRCAMKVVEDERAAIERADNAELTIAVAVERRKFLESQSLMFSPVDVDNMYVGEGPHDVECNYTSIWKRTGRISWQDDQLEVHPQFLTFHRANPLTRNELFSIWMRVAHKDEARKILDMIKIAVLARYGQHKANIASHLLDGTQEWFLNLRAKYHDQHNGRDAEEYVKSLPEDLGRGILHLSFQNHPESDWDSHRVLRILAEDFGLTFLSQQRV